MAYDTLVFRLQDSEADTREASFPVRIPQGSTIEEIQDVADYFAEVIDNVSGSEIVAISVTLSLTVPTTGIKTEPLVAALNERGGLITFDTDGSRAASVWIPAIARTIMPGDTFVLTETNVAALITAMTTTGSGARPVTEYDQQYVTARKGVKSIRKQ